MNDPKPITAAWGIRDGEELLADIYRPENQTGAAYVFFFGGGWISGNKETFAYFGTFRRALLEAGITIIAPNYRLCVDGRRFPVPMDDCADALRWVLRSGAEYGVDPDRIAIGGISAGGHLSLMMGMAGERFGDRTKPFPKIRCIADMCGPSDLRGGLDVTDSHVIAQCYAAVFGADESTWEVQYDAASPITYLRAKPDEAPLPPLMAMHGRCDELVSPRQSEMMVEEYRRRGQEAILFIVENGRHIFTGVEGMPPPRPTFFQLQKAMKDFIEKHTA